LRKVKKKRLVVPAEAKYLRQVREFAEKYGKSQGFSRKDINSLKISLDEICSNIVLYAYRDMERGDIQIEIKRENGSIIVHIEDRGVEFDYGSVKTPNLQKYVEQKMKGGLGLHLVKTMNDEVRYERVGGRNIYTLQRNLESEY
jgi:anti-sigma regulatory factor (Ser/Thr protein kinase)